MLAAAAAAADDDDDDDDDDDTLGVFCEGFAPLYMGARLINLQRVGRADCTRTFLRAQAGPQQAYSPLFAPPSFFLRFVGSAPSVL